MTVKNHREFLFLCLVDFKREKRTSRPDARPLTSFTLTNFTVKVWIQVKLVVLSGWLTGRSLSQVCTPFLFAREKELKNSGTHVCLLCSLATS